MRVPLIRPKRSANFDKALQMFQLGLYQKASELFMKELEASPDDEDALQFARLCHRRMMPVRNSSLPKLVWQFRPEESWEYDWIHQLLDGAIDGEVVDNTWSHISDPMVVVDNRIVAEKTLHYRRAFEQGVRVILLHLSDEIFADDYSAYRYCDGAIRNCRSDMLSAYSNIFFFPLGYKKGFAKPDFTPKPSGERKYVWSFAGDPNKSTRTEMAAAMNRVPGGYWHKTSGFGAADRRSDAHEGTTGKAG